MGEMSLKIFLAESQPKVRYGLRVLLEQQEGWKVTGEASDTKELLEKASADCPDLILVDWDLPGIPAEKLLPILRRKYPFSSVISLSRRHEHYRAAVDSGADASVSKTEPPNKLIKLIQELQAGEAHV